MPTNDRSPKDKPSLFGGMFEKKDSKDAEKDDVAEKDIEDIDSLAEIKDRLLNDETSRLDRLSLLEKLEMKGGDTVEDAKKKDDKSGSADRSLPSDKEQKDVDTKEKDNVPDSLSDIPEESKPPETEGKPLPPEQAEQIDQGIDQLANAIVPAVQPMIASWSQGSALGRFLGPILSKFVASPAAFKKGVYTLLSMAKVDIKIPILGISVGDTLKATAKQQLKASVVNDQMQALFAEAQQKHPEIRGLQFTKVHGKDIPAFQKRDPQKMIADFVAVTKKIQKESGQLPEGPITSNEFLLALNQHVPDKLLSEPKVALPDEQIAKKEVSKDKNKEELPQLASSDEPKEDDSSKEKSDSPTQTV